MVCDRDVLAVVGVQPYRAFFIGMNDMLGAKELWRSRAPPKVKFFFCLALHVDSR